MKLHDTDQDHETKAGRDQTAADVLSVIVFFHLVSDFNESTSPWQASERKENYSFIDFSFDQSLI